MIMTQPQQIAIYGCGGSGRELAWLVQSCDQEAEPRKAVCFIDDDPALQGQRINGLPVLSLDAAAQDFPAASIVCSAGSPRARQKMVENARSLGFGFATLIHPRVERSEFVKIGRGSVVCAGSILTVNVTLGEHVQINIGCTISHDAVLDDYCTLAPGVHITGCNHLGRGAFLGAGAVIVNGTIDDPIEIGDYAVIGAGAVVTGSVPAGETVAGVPARPLT